MTAEGHLIPAVAHFSKLLGLSWKLC